MGNTQRRPDLGWGLVAGLSIWVCAGAFQCSTARTASWHALAKRIASTSLPESAAVVVLFDDDLFEYLGAALPDRFAVVPFHHPDVPRHDAFVPSQLGRMYREVTAVTGRYPDVWVVGRRSASSGRRRAARFADQSASMIRQRVLRDSLQTPEGTLEFSRWVDRPGGVAQRADIASSLAYADSVMAVGIPKPIPITVPFTTSELRVDPDTLSLYMSKLADTSFYSIGGCSEVEIVNWEASWKLGSLGPGVVPVLVERVTDADPFVRERVQEALQHATQDDRILARSDGEYITFYDKPGTPPADVVRTWWGKYGRFWSAPDTTRPIQR